MPAAPQQTAADLVVRSTHIGADTLLKLHASDPERYPVLLQSTAANARIGRYDILMAFPGERLRLRADGSLEGRAQGSTFLTSLDEWFKREQVPTPVDHPSLPFHGGWFLLLGYELAREIEAPLRELPAASDQVADAVRIPAGIVRCRMTGEAWIVAEPEHAGVVQTIAADIAKASAAAECVGSIIAGAVQEEEPERYLAAVATALDHIRAGDIYQANLSRGWLAHLRAGVAPHDVYRRLCRANAGPFAAIASLGHSTIVSSSPERLIEVRNGVIATRPIAGTRPRSMDAKLDMELLRQLRADPKERAEHTMLIDLERNDLGKVCEAGSVHVDEFMSLESYAHVHHLVSNVRGRMRTDVTPAQAIAAVFPGGTITGCPKIRCMQIIGALEGTPRHAYTGSLGYLNRDGSLDLNILIRTLEIRGREVRFRAGAGIVADSEPRRELDETRAKARGLVAALE
jgi:anthranilate synthase component 1